MGDLTAMIPTESETVRRIYEYWKTKGDSEHERGYLGASIIGSECDRLLWFTYRGLAKRNFTGRVYRLFNSGHLAEPRFIEELRAIGCEVHDRDPNSNKQFEVSAISGHFSGHMDGVVLGVPEAPKTWHLVEFKTHSDKSFEKVKADGVKKSKPTHYAQCQVYMGLGKLTRALYLAVNKNTDELYSERIEFNAKEFAAIMARAERIIKSTQPCDRCATRPDDFRCKMCDASDLCWGTGTTALPIPAITCKSCCHATPEMDGDARWSCTKTKDMKPCEKHLVLPGLLTFCEPCDGSSDWIMFKNADGQQWQHGQSGWSTVELTKTPTALVGNEAITKAKEAFGGSVTGFEVPSLSLIDQYPPEDSEMIWSGKPAAMVLNPDLTAIRNLRITNGDDNAETNSVEYDGQYLVVVYKKENVAVVWKGKS